MGIIQMYKNTNRNQYIIIDNSMKMPADSIQRQFNVLGFIATCPEKPCFQYLRTCVCTTMTLNASFNKIEKMKF